MKRWLLMLLLVVLLLSGCSFDKQEDSMEIVSTETEVLVPEVTDEEFQNIKKGEILIQVKVMDDMKFSPKYDDELPAYIYLNETTFDYCKVDVGYMPNFDLFSSNIVDIVFKELENGYVVTVTDQGIGIDQCNKILNAIQIKEYDPIETVE